MIAPMVVLEPSEKSDIQNIVKDTEESDEFKKEIFLTPAFVQALRILLPFFNDRGLLDL